MENHFFALHHGSKENKDTRDNVTALLSQAQDCFCLWRWWYLQEGNFLSTAQYFATTNSSFHLIHLGSPEA